jgi:hypothetical protein
MKRAVLSAALALLGGVARAGHEFPFYPSFYPQEITIEALDAQSAAQRLAEGTLHAYAGDLAAPPPKTSAAESLGAFVVATLPPGASCERAYAAEGGFTSHPYPVTPFHADYLHHADLLERKTTRLPAHARIERVDVRSLLARASTRYNGWSGPPWLRQGWFHAYLLLAPAVADARIEEAARRLMRAEHRSLAQRIALERELVALLQSRCEKVVLGYTTRREHYGVDYSKGVENVGRDSLEGIASPIFVRTVKLRDFPWNGWLHVAAPAPPAGDWNPVVGGFGGAFGALAAHALLDAALFPSPQGGGWVANRVEAKRARPGAPIAVPEDAMLPGQLKRVGSGKTAASRIIYDVRNSSFHDGTPMSVADILYAYVFAAHPDVAPATALARERLKGLRFLGTHVDTLAFGEDKLTYEVPRFEVYLDAAGDGAETLAPPWSTLPWHLLALFEEGARRGELKISAFDPVRDAALARRLEGLARELEARAHIPPALKSRVKAQEARARYKRLREFYAAHGHWLVTNGPYLLDRWDGKQAVLTVFRDPTYPRGLGSYDAHALPLKAHVVNIERRGDSAAVHTEIEWLERRGRDAEIVRGSLAQHLAGRPRSAAAAAAPVCRYLLVGPGGRISTAGAVRADVKGVCGIRLGPGEGRLVVAALLGGNAAHAPVRIVPWGSERR